MVNFLKRPLWFVFLLLFNNKYVRSRVFHMTPLKFDHHNDTSKINLQFDEHNPTSVVDLSGLMSHTSFNDIPSLYAQLEVGGPSWNFQRQDEASNRDYFVGLTRDSSARISFYRYATKSMNMTHVAGIIQDIARGYWYEVKPNIDGYALLTTIADRDIAPYADPVLPQTNQRQKHHRKGKKRHNKQPKKQQTRKEPMHSRKSQIHTQKAQVYRQKSQRHHQKSQIHIKKSYFETALHGLLKNSRKLVAPLFPWIHAGNNDPEDTIIDIMVVWTHKAECIKSHLPANCTGSTRSRQHMKLAVKFFLLETNAAFASSGLQIRLRLVHEQRVSYQEYTFVQALRDLTDGNIPNVQERRKQYEADMVMLLMDQTQDYPETGIAYNNYDNIDADYMYSVVATQYTSVWFLPAHELGHNFGCSHDRGTVGMCHDEDKTSYGYRDPEGRFRTIMSYPCQARECDNNLNHEDGSDNNNHQCPLIPYFSNNHNDSRYEGAPLGGSANNCAGQIDNVKEQISNLY